MPQQNSYAPGVLSEIAGLFFRLGLIAFGGPAAHIAMMEDEFVTRRKWITHEHFLDLVGATNLIPGPNSTEMTMHLGYERGGWAGLFVAGSCFIFPAAVVTGVLAWFYVTYGALPEVEPFLYGIKPAVIAIILGAVWKLGRKAVRDWRYVALGLVVATATLAGVGEIWALLAGGLAGMLWFRFSDREESNTAERWIPLLFQDTTSVATAGAGVAAAAASRSGKSDSFS